jgi:hypothetical protein
MNVFDAHSRIVQDYATYIQSFLNIADPAIRTTVEQELYPMSWEGSLAEILEQRRALPQALFANPDPAVAAWARQVDGELARIAAERRAAEWQEDESFE